MYSFFEKIAKVNVIGLTIHLTKNSKIFEANSSVLFTAAAFKSALPKSTYQINLPQFTKSFWILHLIKRIIFERIGETTVYRVEVIYHYLKVILP